jgi:hypothetical protein
MHPIPVRRGIGVLVLVAGVAAATHVGTQTRYLTTAPGTWKPWKPFTAVASTRQDQAATPALVRAFETELLALNAILKRAPGVASPVGFSVETWGNLAGYRTAEHAPGQPAGSAMPLAGNLTFGAFPIFEYDRNGKTIREDTGETALLQFAVNQIGSGIIDKGNVLEWGPVDRDAFLEPQAHGEVAGLPAYGDGLVIARDPAALWSPLSMKAALDLVAEARKLELASLQASAEKATARLAVVKDPAWRAKRLKDAEAAASKMPDPKGFMKQIEEAITIEETSLVKELGPTGGTGKGLLDAQRALAAATDWIAELSPTERAAPACYAEKGGALRSKFREAPSSGCQPLVRPNYAYFNMALPRSTPQVVIITPVARCFDTADKYNSDANSKLPSGCRANRALIETLDKDALRAWVR